MKALLIAAILCLISSLVQAQEYPAKGIRIITAPAGGGADFIARFIAQGLSNAFGKPAIVENRPTSIIADTVAKAPSDGYTLLVAGPNFWTGPLFEIVE